MPRFSALLPSHLIFATVLCTVGLGLAAVARQRGRDRRRILAEGTCTEGVITELIANGASDRVRVKLRFQAVPTGPEVETTQTSTLGAVRSLGLSRGTPVRICFLPRWPRSAFVPSLAVAERIEENGPAGGNGTGESPPSVHFIAFSQSSATQKGNAFHRTGDGDVTISTTRVRFHARRARLLWMPKAVVREFPREALTNVEVWSNVVRCEVSEPHLKSKPLQFFAVNPEEAREIGALLPDSRTANFVPQLAERAAFNERLLEMTPRAPVTPILVFINVALFVVAAALGGGIFVPNGAVLIRLGSDYTPLTAGGEWWRLLTSIFLHFGFVHLAFNMWALWVNGVVAERLYGSTRYLTLYLVAGVSGSVVSYLWHPLVNGAGASGAIFGVVGALLAYFLRTDTGVPRSVLRVQRDAAALYIVISLLNAARIRGIDNAAHIGGLVAGFAAGWLLCRPLDPKRDEQPWTAQWLRALTVIAVTGVFAGYCLKIGKWHPRVTYDPSGRPVQLSELAPLPRNFAGVTLGMTSEDLLRRKGQPLEEDANDWTYDSIDRAHDGFVEVYFSAVSGRPSRVWAVLFFGKPEAEPPGIASVLGFSRQDLRMRYGEPVSESAAGRVKEYLYFRNGLTVLLDGAGKVEAYGVYAIPQ